MSQGDGAPAGEIISKVRRRASASSFSSWLSILLSLMFFAAIGGFVWGMWEQVAAAPLHYQHLRVKEDGFTVAGLSGRAAHLIVFFQEKLSGRADGDQLTRHAEDTGSPPLPPPPESPSVPTVPRPEPTSTETPVPDPITDLTPDVEPDPTPGPEPDPTPGPEPPVEPGPGPTEPVHTPDVVPELPKVQPPPPVPAKPTLGPKVRETLDKAHKAFDIAWKYHLKARPEAPSRGRDAANRKAIRYLKISRKLYEAVLKQKISKNIRERINRRLVELNRTLYWSNKMARIR